MALDFQLFWQTTIKTLVENLQCRILPNIHLNCSIVLKFFSVLLLLVVDMSSYSMLNGWLDSPFACNDFGELLYSSIRKNCCSSNFNPSQSPSNTPPPLGHRSPSFGSQQTCSNSSASQKMVS